MKNDKPHTMTEQHKYHGKNKKKEKNLKSTTKIIQNAVKNKPRSIKRFIWGTEKQKNRAKQKLIPKKTNKK